MSELIQLQDGLKLRELEISEAMEQILFAKTTINQIIKEHSDEKTNVTIYLPKGTFDDLKINSLILKNNFNWKKVALEILNISEEPLTTLMLYQKAKIKYPLELADRSKSVKGFSAALYYLKFEGKILQIRKDKKNFYGLELKHIKKEIKKDRITVPSFEG